MKHSKQVEDWIKSGGIVKIIPTKKLSWKQKVAMERGTVRGRGSISFGGYKANTSALKLGTLSNMEIFA